MKALKMSVESQLNSLLKHANRRNYTIRKVEIRATDNVVFAFLAPIGDSYSYITLPSIMDMDVDLINLIIN